MVAGRPGAFVRAKILDARGVRAENAYVGTELSPDQGHPPGPPPVLETGASGVNSPSWLPHYLYNHWIGILFLLPFLCGVLIHHRLGLSDAFLLARDQRDRDSQLFNLILVVIFSTGVTLFLAHTFILAKKGWGWVMAKLVLVAAYWALAIRLV